MKITWFGGTTLRIHIGGQIVVVDSDLAPAAIDRQELTSGSDMIVSLSGKLKVEDGKAWRPRPIERLLDIGDVIRPVDICSIGAGTLLLDADGEPPLLVIAAEVPPLGRWVERAAIILAGEAAAERGATLLEAVAPRLLALASEENVVERAFAQLSSLLDGTGLMALEQGMALEA